MGLFASLDIQGMGLTSLEELGQICQQMMSEPVAEAHWNDYQELFARVNSQLVVVRAVITIQSAVRGKQARDEAEIRRKELADQTKAALTIQSAFRMFQAKNTLQALKTQQELKTQHALSEADTTLAEKDTKPAVLARIGKQEKIEIARLKELYSNLPPKPKGAKASHRNAIAQRKALQELDDYIEQIVHLVEAQLTAEKNVQDLARTVTFPADFKPQGAMVDYGTFLYPGGGYLLIGDKHIQLHPNRSLVHARQELADTATLATAQAYFNSLLKACRTVVEQQKAAPLQQISSKLSVNDTTDAGGAFFWSILYTRYNPKAHAQGFAGSIEHIDSNYENSAWLPPAKRGKCRNCGKGINRYNCADHRR